MLDDILHRLEELRQQLLQHPDRSILEAIDRELSSLQIFLELLGEDKDGRANNR